MIKFISGVAALALALVSFQGVSASTSASPLQAASAYYVSPTGNDANIGTINAPFKTIQKATSKTVAGDTIILLAGTYTGATTVTEVGAPNTPIVIRGEGAVFNGGSLTFKNSQWLIIENLSFVGGTNQVTLQNSHYLAFRGNKFDFVTRGIYILDYSSHLLIENNEFYQSCVIGRTWTQLKGSTCEGGAVYGSSFGGGTYHIRNNWVHDAFNGFIFSDDSAGQWMNANVFIYNNRFERIVDDPAEPEGDSFNFHVYKNTMIDTHRMTSITTKGLGPVFVYNNVQITKGNPTNEASRLNSAFKLDLSGGFTNGVYLFNNTIVGEAAVNFYAFDMLSRTIATPLTVRNNVYVTKLNAFSSTPTGGSINYDISKAPFGMTQANGIVADPLVQANGVLSPASKAIGKSTLVSIPTYFASSAVVPTGANLGAFQSMPAPAWVTPPSYPTANIPANVTGWVEVLAASVNQPIATPTSIVFTPTTIVASPTATTLVVSPTPTRIFASPTPTTIIATQTTVKLPTTTATNAPTTKPTNVPTNSPGVQTLILQPNGATGIDAYMLNTSATSNYGNATDMGVGENNDTANKYAHGLIKFDLSSLPANATIVSATLSLWTSGDLSNTNRTIQVYRLKTPFVEGQVNWNRSASGVNWQVAGAKGAKDKETNAIGSVLILANESLNTEKQIGLDPAKIQELVNGTYTNNGFILIADTELDDRFNYKTSDTSNAVQRPKLVIQYVVGEQLNTLSNIPDAIATTAPTIMPTITATSVPTETVVLPTETPVPTQASVTPVEVTYDNTDAGFAYSPEWTNNGDSVAYDGSFNQTTENGASATLTFEGTSFSVLYTGGPAFRSMDVYVDDVLVGSINQKADGRTYQLRWDYTGQLEPGSHVLKLVFVTDNTSGDTKGSLDAVIIR